MTAGPKMQKNNTEKNEQYFFELNIKPHYWVSASDSLVIYVTEGRLRNRGS